VIAQGFLHTASLLIAEKYTKKGAATKALKKEGLCANNTESQSSLVVFDYPVLASVQDIFDYPVLASVQNILKDFIGHQYC
jgi:hypothetical protein